MCAASRSRRRATARDVTFGVEPHLSPSGRRFLWVTRRAAGLRLGAGHRRGGQPRRLDLGHADARRLHRPRRARRPGGAARHEADTSAMMKLIMTLRGQGVTDTRVLKAMESVDRGVFVQGTFADARLRRHAAADRLRPDHQPALRRRPDDAGARGRAAPQGARGRHRLRLPGRDPRPARPPGLDRRPPPRTGARGARALRGARPDQHHRLHRRRQPRACPTRRPSTASWSPPPPRTRRGRSWRNCGSAVSWSCRSGSPTPCRR